MRPIGTQTIQRKTEGKDSAPVVPKELEHVSGRLWATDASGNILKPSLEDIKQGDLADCYLLAALAAVVHTNPDHIVNMIEDHGDDSYTVTFEGIGFFSSSKQKVTAEFPAGLHAAVGSRKAIWPLVIEKAYAQEKGGYDKIGQGGHAEIVVDDIIDASSTDFRVREETPDYIIAKVAQAKKKKWPVTISAPKPEDASDEKKAMARDLKGFYFWHIYAVIDVDAEGNRLKLFNPAGRDHPNETGWVPIEQVQKFFFTISIND